MPLTRYIRIFENKDASASNLLLCTKKASIITIPSDMLSEIEAGKITESERKTLLDLGFLVEGPEAERREMLGFIDEINAMGRTFAAKVVMNLDCNLACKYCFEGQRKGSFYMTPETVDLFIGFVRHWAEALEGRTGEEKIIITFYGGEPLLSLELIAYVSGALKGMAEELDIAYVAYMVSNGTLLTPRVVVRLKPLGLEGAVVTLDGPRDQHDHSRPFKSDRGSFEAIFKNLLAVSDMIGIQVGGNYMQDNFREFPRLLDYMLENGLTPEKLEAVNFNPVTVESEGYGPIDFHEGCCSLDEPWLFEASIFLREEILKRGYKAPKSIMPGICSLDMKDNYLVNYEGSLYKCPGLIGREEFKIGDLKTGTIYSAQPQGKDNWKNEECLACAYLPLCFGGCRYMKLVRDGNMEGIDCRKKYYDAVLESLIRQDLRYGLVGK